MESFADPLHAMHEIPVWDPEQGPADSPAPSKQVDSCAKEFCLKRAAWGFSGGSAVKNLSANADDNAFNPQSGKIPHAVKQLSPMSHNY